PTSQHAAHAVAAAQAGKHVLLQKPMALTLADCDAIIAAVQRYGVKFSLCYQMRADPVNRKMKELLDEGAVGHVAVVRRRHAIGALLSPGFARPGNWHLDPVQNMGMFMDDASHAADWFYWMLGRPTSVIAEIDNVVTPDTPHGLRIRAVPRPLIDYLRGRTGPLATAEDGRVCIEMILGAYRAGREGRRVHFPLQD